MNDPEQTPGSSAERRAKIKRALFMHHEQQ
jgi:hypothetical protein